MFWVASAWRPYQISPTNEGIHVKLIVNLHNDFSAPPQMICMKQKLSGGIKCNPDVRVLSLSQEY